MNSVSTWLTKQAADDRVAERLADLRTGAGAEHQRNAAEHGAHRGHQDRPEARAGRPRAPPRAAIMPAPFGDEREIDHHDAVLLDDADQQHDADDADHVERHAERSCSASSAPSPADGKVDRIVTGWMALS